ncbi:hypothetical protein [Streptomyces sp. MAR4 CNX-425]|uniref:hypothetical protein n=1 Tax=Streptomyces sp. MAR4 CNX-425 TaxID=3406343 RepID=UPI003B50D9A0
MTEDELKHRVTVPLSGPPIGEVHLYAPSDWLDILEDPKDEEAAQARFEELARLTFPGHTPDVQQAVAAGVMNTRRIFLADGMLSCGLVALPRTEDGPVLWEICSGVVELGTLEANLDSGTVLARFLGEELTDGDAYIESFPTKLGAGVGLISKPQLFPDGSVALAPASTRTDDDGGAAPVTTLGLAVGLAIPPGGGHSLLVIGQCLDPGQVNELAGIIALIAGNSTIEVYAQQEARINT